MSDLIKDLQDAIRATHKTQFSIAKEGGFSQAILSRLLSGERGVRIDTAQRIADTLDMEIVLRPKQTPKSKGR